MWCRYRKKAALPNAGHFCFSLEKLPSLFLLLMAEKVHRGGGSLSNTLVTVHIGLYG